MTIDKILENIQQYDCKLVEVTGGEPLLQKEFYGKTEYNRSYIHTNAQY